MAETTQKAPEFPFTDPNGRKYRTFKRRGRTVKVYEPRPEGYVPPLTERGKRQIILETYFGEPEKGDYIPGKKNTCTVWDGEKWVIDNNQLYNDGTNVMIGTSTVVSSSAFTVQSTTKGVLISRMTQSQKDAIESPSNGLLVYQTDGTSGFYYYDGSMWTPLKSQSSSSGTGSDSNTLIYTVSGF